MKFRVRFNSHKYADLSDPPKHASLTVFAKTADEAREIVRAREQHGKRWIGIVYEATWVLSPDEIREFFEPVQQ